MKLLDASHEELIINQIENKFGNKECFFIQVGSNDGVQYDPLHNLIIRNEKWKGVFIEPISFVFKKLKLNYGNNTRFVFENIAISTDDYKTKNFYYL